MTTLQKRWWLGRDLVWRARGESSAVVTSTPVAAFSASLAGLGATFDASASTDTGSTLTGYAWDFGDGSTGTGVKTSHTYATGGTFTVMLTVTDGLNNSDSTVTTLTFAVGHPTAAFTVATVNLAAQFDASSSTDVGSTITSYAWTFGDGASGSGKTVSHTYTAGTFTATLTITDASGQTASVSHALTTVAPPVNQAPTAAFSTTISKATVSVNGSASIDPDGTIAAWAWTWGDGTTSAGVTSSHTYATSGTYTVSLVVTDNKGAASTAATATVTVTLTNTPPPASFTVSPSNLTVAVNGSASTVAAPAVPIYYLDQSVAAKAFTLSLGHGSALQCAVRSNTTGNWLASQAAFGSDGSNTTFQTAYISRVEDADGSLLDAMQLIDAGHGSGIGLEYVTSVSKSRIYMNWGRKTGTSGAGPSSDNTWDIVRFYYDGGFAGNRAALQATSGDGFEVVIPGSRWGHKVDPQFDIPGGHVLLRHAAPGSSDYFERANLADFWNKTVTYDASPITIDFTGKTLQGFCTVGESLFIYTGAPDSLTADPPQIVEYSWTTGLKVSTTYSTAAFGRNSDGTYPGGHYEPESLTAYQPSGAQPVLYAGVTVGASGSYTYPIYSMSLSKTNRVVSYAWTFGDGATATGATASHTYSSAGAYTITLTTTDEGGVKGSLSKTVTVTAGGGTSTGPIYSIGNYDDNIPTSVRVYTFADLGLTAGVTNLQQVVDALPAAGIIQLPNGYQGVIPNFAHHGSNYGIYNANLRGLIGGVDSATGQLTAKITMAGNAMSSTQLATYPKRVRNSGGTTIGAFHTNGTSALYFGGIEFDGADQQSVVDGDGQETGPACWFGFSMNNIGAGSIFQNLLLRGFGKANDTTPPGEVGAWNETHSSGLIFRRVEHDGRLPNSTVRRSGGIQWNASTGSLLEDVYSHDDYYSGVTYSFTSTPTTASESHDFTTRRLRVAHNSNHGNKNDSFAALNLEFNYGTNHHYQPRFSRDQYQNGSESHVRMWVYSASLGTADKNTSHVFHQPTWDDSNPVDNGCFSIKMAGYTAGGGGFKAPTVYLTANESAPATPYISTGGQVPSNVTTANNYYVLKHN